MAINDYATAAEIKAVISDASLGSGYDALLALLATRASRLIDRLTGRKPGAYEVDADVTLYFDGSGGREQWIEELAAAPTTVSVAEGGNLSAYTAWASTDYLLWPYNALDRGEPYLRLDVDGLNGTKAAWYRFPKAVKIVGKFGYSTSAPDDVKQAVIVQCVRWWKRGQQAFQDVGAIVDLGQLSFVKKLDPDVELLVEHLRRLAV